jgi:membrane dipeptidase
MKFSKGRLLPNGNEGSLIQINPGILPDYSQWVHLVAAMLRGGFTPEEAGKIAGGNYMRIFRAAVG